MIPWWIGTLIGALSTALINTMCRTWEINLRNIIIMSIPLTVCNIGFWYGFKHAPKFVNCWFIGSGMNTISAVALGLLFFHESITVKVVCGIILVIAGKYLL